MIKFKHDIWWYNARLGYCECFSDWSTAVLPGIWYIYKEAWSLLFHFPLNLIDKLSCSFSRTMKQAHTVHFENSPDNSKVYGVSMGPTWGWQDPGGPHVGPWVCIHGFVHILFYSQIMIKYIHFNLIILYLQNMCSALLISRCCSYLFI